MKKTNKIGIVTIIDNNNYGNRLQNYALQVYLKKYGFNVITLKNIAYTNFKSKSLFIGYLKRIRKNIINAFLINKGRSKKFKEFNRNIHFSKKYITPYSKISKKYDYFVVGSDQVWMPNFGRLSDVDLLTFANDNQKVAYAASFGLTDLPELYGNYVKENLLKFKAISVREYTGKKIVTNLTKRKDVEVLIDPTMLLSNKEWEKVMKIPNQWENRKYILLYFLGEYSTNRKKEIEKFAKVNNCKIINLMDKNSAFYETGPSEFLYLIKNAFLIFTDSFHACVFSIIFNKPFIVFERLGGKSRMNSRIDTLLEKFQLQNRKYNEEKLTNSILEFDYEYAFKILRKEKIKTDKFISVTLNNQ